MSAVIHSPIDHPFLWVGEPPVRRWLNLLSVTLAEDGPGGELRVWHQTPAPSSATAPGLANPLVFRGDDAGLVREALADLCGDVERHSCRRYAG